MPNDATHRIINYLMLSIFIVLNFYFDIEQDYKFIMIFMGSYILGTEVLSPDLDIRSKPGDRLGFLSYPIRKLSNHRGLGHNIFIGWILKALYVTLIMTIILVVIDKLGYNIYLILKYIDKRSIFAFLIGLFLSNAVHIMADNIL